MSDQAANWCSASGNPQDPRAAAQSDPRSREIRYSYLCSRGYRRLLITGQLKDMLVHHFAAPEFIEYKDLRDCIWRPDEQTGILIESLYLWRGQLTEKRPAILIKPNAQHNLQLGIGDYQGVDEQGQELYSTAWVGSHTLFCLHGSGAGAELLASEVQRELTEFSVLVRKRFQLLQWKVVEVGEIGLLEEAKQDFVIPVTIAWAYQQSWKLSLESLRLRKIPLSVFLDGVPFQETI